VDTGRVARLLAAALTVALVATGCSSDEDVASTEATTTSSETSSSTEAPVETTKAPATTEAPSTTEAPGCTSSLAAGVTQEAGTVADVDRTWQLAVPTDHPVGLIVDLHGTGGTIESQDTITRLSDEGTARGYVVVTPQGLEIPARWTVPGIPGPDDVAFITELVTGIADVGCLDGPMFVTGKSSGAAMTSQLACESNLFTGAAPIGGIALYRRCPEGEPVSVITFHGTEDAWVPYEGPEGWEEVELMAETFFIGDTAETVAAFASRAGCDDATSIAELGEDTTLEEWSCPDGHRVAFYTIEGGGHTHPGAHARQVYEDAELVDSVGHTTDTFDGTEVILDFFDSVREDTTQ
jgi:polyhydroxybutyrate depolymerase